MSDDDYAAFVNRALFLDRPDPVAAWRELTTVSAGRRPPEPAREIRIEADGTDLRLRVDGRTWINSNGRRNMPSGEVFTGPLEDSANGTIRFTIPSSPRGVAVEGVELTFENGEVDESHEPSGDRPTSTPRSPLTPAPASSASLGSARTSASTARPARSCSTRRWPGPSTSRSAARIPRPAGRNSSALHWDLICDLRSGGRLTADGEPVNVDLS